LTEPKRKDPSYVTVTVIAAWMVAVCLAQWMFYGPHIDLERLTKLPLGFLLETWLPLLREFMTAPLGK
jgi:hypothetical protein